MATVLKDPKSIQLVPTQFKHGRGYTVKDGDTVLGTVCPVLGSLNRPTGTWCYRVGAESGGYINWSAGRDKMTAARKLVKRVGGYAL